MVLGLLWIVNIAVAIASACLLAGLVYVYARNLRDLKSPFTAGLLLFGFLFLLQNLVAVFVYLSMNDQALGASVAMPMLALNAAELAGFGTLFFITWR